MESEDLNLNRRLDRVSNRLSLGYFRVFTHGSLITLVLPGLGYGYSGDFRFKDSCCLGYILGDRDVEK